MSVGAINFDQFTIEELTQIYTDNGVKSKVYRGVKYTQENPGTVAKKTAKISIPIIFVGGAVGAVVGFTCGGGAGTPVGIGVGVGTVVGVSMSVVHISHSSHYETWKRQLEDRCSQELENRSVQEFSDYFVDLLEEIGENTEGIVDPISKSLIRLPVMAPDNHLYDFDTIVTWIRTKPSHIPASYYRICDFTEHNLEFDFPSAEKIIRAIEQYRQSHQNDQDSQIKIRIMHLIERDLYERICSLWKAEIDKLQKCLDRRTLTEENFTHCVERLRNLFRLNTIGDLLVHNPLIQTPVEDIMTEMTSLGSSSGAQGASASSQQESTVSSGSSSSLAGPSQSKQENGKASITP